MGDNSGSHHRLAPYQNRYKEGKLSYLFHFPTSPQHCIRSFT